MMLSRPRCLSSVRAMYQGAQALLVAANQSAVTKPDGTRVPASLAVFRMADNGKLEILRKYDVESGDGRSLMWAGFLRLK